MYLIKLLTAMVKESEEGGEGVKITRSHSTFGIQKYSNCDTVLYFLNKIGGGGC